jgi:hypothetical protein
LGWAAGQLLVEARSGRDRSWSGPAPDRPDHPAPQNANVGDVLSLLWFKRRLPKYAAQFMEM